MSTTTPSVRVPDARRLEQARQAVGLVFAASGFAAASWLSRTPALRHVLHLSPSQLGLLLLCVSGGAVCSLPLSGALVHRLGSQRATLGGLSTLTGGMLVVAAGLALPAEPLVAVGLVAVGAGTGVCDVAMNVQGADVERRLGRAIMPRFHAGFSVGTVGGALAGAALAGAGLRLQLQLVGTAVLVLAVGGLATRRFVAAEAPEPDAPVEGAGVARAWRERRTVLIGLMVLAFAFAEGSANDWLAIGLVDGHGTSPAVGAIGFAVFDVGMVASRLWGGLLLDRFGRVPVLWATALFALTGLLLVVLSPGLPAVFAGALLWGIGAALGFPVGMSAAADDPARAPVRISVVSSIGYTAFLAGPPVIGFLADAVGVLHALLVVVVLLVLALVTAGSARPLVPAPVAP